MSEGILPAWFPGERTPHFSSTSPPSPSRGAGGVSAGGDLRWEARTRVREGAARQTEVFREGSACLDDPLFDDGGMLRETSTGFSVCCCSIALRNRPAAEAVRVVAEAGFAGVELWGGHFLDQGESDWRALRGTCDTLGLSVPILAPYFSFTRGSERAAESLRTAETVLRAGEILGASRVRTFVDCGPDGLASARAGEADWKAAVEGLRALCDLDPGTEFVVETHDNTLADGVEPIRRLFGAVDRANLRLNFQINDDFLRRGFLAALDELFPLVAHMHWQQATADGRHTYLEEEGMIDFGALIEVLRARSYAGTVSVEYCWKDVEEDRVRSAARFLGKLLAARGSEPEHCSGIHRVAGMDID